MYIIQYVYFFVIKKNPPSDFSEPVTQTKDILFMA